MWKPTLVALALFVATVPTSESGAQVREPKLDAEVNYVYAAQFGFGGYSIGGLNVQVYSIPIEFTVPDLVMDWDLKIGLPVIYGRYEVSGESEGFHASAATNSIGFQPKLQLDIPVFEGFRISPLGALGVAAGFGSSVSIDFLGEPVEAGDIDDDPFFTYQIGISSLYERKFDHLTFSFGNAFIYAGDAPLDGSSSGTIEGYGTLRSGIDFRHPLGFKLGDLVPDASVFFIYSLFTPALKFTRIGDDALSVPQIFEVGFTLGSESPLVLPVLGELLDGMRIGAGYDRGKGFEAIHIVFGFPF